MAPVRGLLIEYLQYYFRSVSTVTVTVTSVAPRMKAAPLGKMAHVVKLWGNRSIARPVHQLDNTDGKDMTPFNVKVNVADPTVVMAQVTVTSVVTTTDTVSVTVPMPCEATDLFYFVGTDGSTIYLNQPTSPVTKASSTSTATFVISPVPVATSSVELPQPSSISVDETTTVVVSTTIEQTIVSTFTVVQSATSSRLADRIPVLAMGPEGWNSTNTIQSGGETTSSTSTTTMFITAPRPTTTITRTVIFANQTSSALEAGQSIISSIGESSFVLREDGN